MGSMRRWVKRLEREASQDAVLIRQRDGSAKAFDRMHVMGQMYLARLDAALGRERQGPPSDVLDALDGATPESRRAVEEMTAELGGFTADLEGPLAKPDDDLVVEDLSEQ